MSEKLIVLSMDAMVSEDIAYLKTKPNFSRLFKKKYQLPPSVYRREAAGI